LNCSNYSVNPLRFEIFITHFVVVISRENACFRVGRVLEREFGYIMSGCFKVVSISASKNSFVLGLLYGTI
jgi:hypothetical protein